jgi:predicted DCC family thiol-disulfide oxidoreductase YuxK
VRLLARLDRRGALRFAPLDAALAAPWRALAGPPGEPPESLVVVDGRGRAHVRAAATAAALRACGGAAALLGRALGAIPARLADPAYLAVSRRRARGGRCLLPLGDPRFLR